MNILAVEKIKKIIFVYPVYRFFQPVLQTLSNTTQTLKRTNIPKDFVSSINIESWIIMNLRKQRELD